jgi:hypothetical protein
MASIDVARARLNRQKDQVVRLLAQLSDARLGAAKTVAELESLGVSKTELADLWNTSRGQIDKMIARGRVGR